MLDFIKEQNEIYLKHIGYDKIQGRLKDGSTTLLDLLQIRAARYPSRQFIGAINKELEIEYMSYKEVDLCAQKLAKYLSVIAEEHETIGIASPNRPELVIAEYATYYSNCINVPLYTTFKEDSLAYILCITKMKVLIATPSFVENVVKSVIVNEVKNMVSLQHVILMDEDSEITKLCASKGIKVSTLNDIIFSDIKNTTNVNPGSTICSRTAPFLTQSNSFKSVRGKPRPTDLATISFTSGTTGMPKGVELTHANFIAQIEAFEIAEDEGYGLVEINTNTLYFSYLPLSHVFERVVFCVNFSKCAKICFFRGSKQLIGEDLKIVKPTFISVVPKILDSFYTAIENEVSNKNVAQRCLYRGALALKKALSRLSFGSTGVLDKLVFNKVAKAFGGEIRYVLCGGASVDPDRITYLQTVLGANIFQGYGQTEGLGANTLSPLSLNDPKSIGIPFPTTQYKLVSIDGGAECEMYMKGHSVMRGYFQPPEHLLDLLLGTGKFAFNKSKVAESAFDAQGWLNTGDVVRYTNQKLYIVGRNKDVVKISNGEFISCEEIENLLKRFEFVGDVFVAKEPTGDSFVAVLSVQNEQTTKRIAAGLRMALHALKQNMEIPKVVDVRRISVIREKFEEIENGILFTPTMKKKRYVFMQKFELEISNALVIDELLGNSVKSN